MSKSMNLAQAVEFFGLVEVSHYHYEQIAPDAVMALDHDQRVLAVWSERTQRWDPFVDINAVRGIAMSPRGFERTQAQFTGEVA